MEDVRVKDEALRLIGLFEVLPRLVVFDLDYTLWPFYNELHSKRGMPYLYPQAKGILQAFQDKGIEMAIASRSPTADIANTFLDQLGIQSMFVAKEIFTSRTFKADHFKAIHRRTGIPFNSMLFFDDEYGNIDTVSKMGVTSILVDDGLNLQELHSGLQKFSSPNEQI
ncbi:magnesium-dependent phosphatase 1 [Dendrobium catenatum]|nr:magnesium-dependent phosphatase 1 [Dendrobium catenatum]